MKIYLMHQTHTDIGYTDRQEKITKYHVDYLKQAIIISEKIANGKKEWEGFIWNNETHWIIERFIEATDVTWQKRLIEAIRRGHIQLAGNYLNLTDLVDGDILKIYLQKARDFADTHKVRLDTAISMDINGWSWGYCDAMYDAGIRYFYTCIHNHHGFVPFKEKHLPFYWEGQSGNKLLVWHGDVYNQGNVSRLVPDVVGKMVDGEFVTEAFITDEQLAYAKAWIDDYLESVKRQGYNYDFLPMTTKGLLVDNAPPNPHIIESIHAFNKKYGDEIEIEMVGLNDFFDILKTKKLDIPTYRGDWNDWWSDGFSSTPDAVAMYKEAQRNYHKIKHLQKDGFKFDLKQLSSLEYNLMMFSEHTWGYFTSVSEPWNKMTKKLEDRNKLFASKASELSDTLLDDYMFADGEMAKAAGRPMLYKVKNPYPNRRTQLVQLYTNWWEEFIVGEGYDLIDANSKERLSFQEIWVDQHSRRQINTWVTLDGFEDKVLAIIKKPSVKRHMPLDPLFTRDETYDYIPPHLDTSVFATQFYMETPHFKIEWDKEEGIHTVYDKLHAVNLLREDRLEGAFTPIYETSEIEHTYKFNVPDMQNIRREYGRNRKLFSSIRDTGKLINVKVLDKGPNIARVQLKYLLFGTQYCIVELKTYKAMPRIDVSLIVQKDTVWQPESLYLSLPFTTQEKETLYLDKANTIIRPRIDQLPETQALFYTTQSGYALMGETRSLNISLPDTPLLHLGTLDPGLIKVHDQTHPNTDMQYAWLMNNYWETNFATNLGGFYRLEFNLFLNDEVDDVNTLMKDTKQLNETYLVYQVKDHEA